MEMADLLILTLFVGAILTAPLWLAIGFSLGRRKPRRSSSAYCPPRLQADPQPYGEWTPEHGRAVTATRRIA